ncbi:MAG: CDP-glycerol glycerophosphotransferase family protein [Erysipelothrix sp.]|nr:CDP-glycerol glycerophosphotransferase family protein [Erysipelothrix sp.]
MKILKSIAPRIYRILFRLGSLLPKKEKMIIFESFLGKQYSDNPKALYDYIKSNYPDYELYWSLNKEAIQLFRHKNIKFIRRLSFKWIISMARARYWVTNTRLPLWLPKPKNTIYLQTWHGTPLKKLGVDIEAVRMPGTSTENYKRNFIADSKKWDYLISPNEYSTRIFKRAFQVQCQIIESGYPRNDVLINQKNKKKELLEKLKLPSDKKIILYAPTWRDNQYYTQGKYKFNLELDLDTLNKELGDNYIILIRAHYLIADQIDTDKYNGFVFDFSSYNEIGDLYLVSDMLITDYSSVFFDYANLRRPILFFVYDLQEYREEIRGFYFDLEKHAPGPLILTNEQLIKEINSINLEEFVPNDKYESFVNTFCSLEDGQAVERVAKVLFDC